MLWLCLILIWVLSSGLNRRYEASVFTFGTWLGSNKVGLLSSVNGERMYEVLILSYSLIRLDLTRQIEGISLLVVLIY